MAHLKKFIEEHGAKEEMTALSGVAQALADLERDRDAYRTDARVAIGALLDNADTRADVERRGVAMMHDLGERWERAFTAERHRAEQAAAVTIRQSSLLKEAQELLQQAAAREMKAARAIWQEAEMYMQERCAQVAEREKVTGMSAGHVFACARIADRIRALRPEGAK
jgi:hypothetical protein